MTRPSSLLLLAACASSPSDPDEGIESGGEASTETTRPGSTSPPDDPGPDEVDGDLSTAMGCAGVFNTDQVLDLHLEVDPADWQALISDATYALFVPATFQCGDEAPMTVGIRRKRSGGSWKVGLKIDFNEIIDGGSWHGLEKLSLENGVSEGDTEDGVEASAYVAEYLAWQIMNTADLVTSRAAFSNVWLNVEVLGVYVNVEQVDKEFLEDRLGDDTGWLYKKSGGVGDGFKTHETDGLDDPYDHWFCFWGSGNTCPVPPDDVLLAELPSRLDIQQLLTFGAVNAYIANTDGLLFKDNNYYWYDWHGGGRVYIPWDLDTTMKDLTSLFEGGGGAGTDAAYDDVLFTHWRTDYELVLLDLVVNRAPLPVIEQELDRVSSVAGPALDADPYVSGTAADAVDGLKAWWTTREADARLQLGL